MYFLRLILISLLSAIFTYQMPFFSNGYASIIKMELGDLTVQADYVVLGKVIEIKSKWDNEKTTINTYVKVAVEEEIKGELNSKDIIITVPGGIVDSETIEIPGMPKFSLNENEKVILFLKKSILDEYQIIGGFQGKYSIVDNKISGSNMLAEEFIDKIHEFEKEKM